MPSPGLRGWCPKPLEDTNLLMNTLHVTHLSLNYKTKSCNNFNPTRSRANNITFVRFSFNLIYIDRFVTKIQKCAYWKPKNIWYIYYTNIHSFINVADGQRFNSNNICACKREVGQNRFISFSSSDFKKKNLYMHVYLDKCSQLKIKIHVYHLFLFCFENIYSPLSCLLLYK